MKPAVPSLTVEDWESGFIHLLESSSDAYPVQPSFNIFLERLMTDAQDDHASTIIICGRVITNL